MAVATGMPRRRIKIDDVPSTRRTALLFPADLPFASWKRIGEQLFLISDSTAWWIGDWLVFGRDKYPDRYRLAIEETSLNYQTLRNYAWVARRFPVSRRRDTLSFQHHMEVVGLTDDEQDRWFERAEQLGWSRNELRRQVRASRSLPEPEPKPSASTLQLSVSPECRERWQTAAQRARVELPEWISVTLDGAVGTGKPIRLSRKNAA